MLDINLAWTGVKDYVLPILVIIASLIIAKVIYNIFRVYVRKITEKTKTNLDNLILDYVEKPFVLLIVIVGLIYSLEFVVSESAIIDTLESILFALLILDLGWFTIGIINAFFENYFVKITKKTKTKLDDMLVPIIKKVITITISLITIMIVLSNYGYDISALLGGFGIAGIAVAMAAQDTIKDVLGGVAVITNRPFEVGDAIRYKNIEGTVTEVSVRYTRIQTWEGTIVTIPNSQIGGAEIENYGKASRRRITVDVGITYETPPRKIQKALDILKEVANSQEYVVKELTRSYIHSYGDFAIVLRLRYYIDREGFSHLFDIKHNINMEIKKRFDKAKIEFAYPTQVIYLKK